MVGMNVRMVAASVAAAASMFGAGSASAGDVNVGVVISGEVQPGVYGRVEIGNLPPPPVLYPQPVVIVHPARPVVVEPIYLHVPPGHAKNWRKHCREYNACDRPVYFVKSAEYEPGYRPGRGNGRGDDDDHGHGHGHGRGRD